VVALAAIQADIYGREVEILAAKRAHMGPRSLAGVDGTRSSVDEVRASGTRCRSSRTRHGIGVDEQALPAYRVISWLRSVAKQFVKGSKRGKE
jgi:hypothetical protein